jgi:hypothetical protein
MKHRKILKFIKTVRESVKGMEFVYTNGSCYQFYLILKSIIPEAESWYDSDHVITKIGERFYDITGEVKCENHLNMDEHYPDTDLRNVRMKFNLFDDSTIKKMKVYEKSL